MIGINEHFLSVEEKQLIKDIRYLTEKNNLDNISRTNCYLEYYTMNKEIHWSFLASLVSRNAGWNMCDLAGTWFPLSLNEQTRLNLFATYERANWMIFQDAYPQLLLYEYSTKKNVPMFHLLQYFSVSSFMEKEWLHFWRYKNKERLVYSLIINEQNVIENPIIKNKLFQKEVFHTLAYRFQDLLRFSSVFFPTLNGDIYGRSVSSFRSLDRRIELGKELYTILFQKNLHPIFLEFALKVVHTGSRADYEKYVYPKHLNNTPMLRMSYPVMTQKPFTSVDWSKTTKVKAKWKKHARPFKKAILITDWYKNKQEQLHKLIKIETIILYWKKR
ncbi:DUF2515 family protein [Niallia taxi]|uniref:DUF2515 family protein n=1 Tax=Niallia taxi TaxID=2499688 RepID=UPI00317A1EA9